jgi:hypothetical protein
MFSLEHPLRAQLLINAESLLYASKLHACTKINCTAEPLPCITYASHVLAGIKFFFALSAQSICTGDLEGTAAEYQPVLSLL